jgi:hypothetical protein
MRGRLIDPVERWLYEGPLWLAGAVIAWRVAAGLLLWGGKLQLWPLPGVIPSQLITLAGLTVLLGLARLLVPRDFSAAAALVGGSALGLAALAMLPRYGWPWEWPRGAVSAGAYAGAGGLLLLVSLLGLALGLHWRRQLRGHGVEWTRQWAQSRPYAARVLALRALHYMGATDTE